MVVKKWSRYLKHPLTVSFVLSILVVFLLARYLPRYYTELVEETSLTNNGEVYYCDLDNDGNSEKLDYYQYDRIFQPTLYLYDSENNFISLWNFLESPVPNSKIFLGDYDNDSIKELFVFTHKADSLFLYVLNSKNDKENIVNRKFIDIGKLSNVEVLSMGLYNLDEDNNKEFLFAVNAEYPNAPQKIYSFNINNRKLNYSPRLNVDIIEPILVEDINSDGKLEIVISNASVDITGSDSESQLIVLNNQLKYLFQPIIFHGGKSKVTASIVTDNNEKFIAVLNSGINADNIYNSLKLYNSRGEQIKETTIKSKSNLKLAKIGDFENIYLFSGNKLLKYSNKLEREKSYRISNGSNCEFVGNIDVLGDSNKEIILKSKANLMILSKNLRSRLNLKVAEKGQLIMTQAKYIDNTNKLAIQVGDKLFLYNFYKNESFFYSHIFYFLIFIFINLLVFLINKLRFVNFKKVFSGKTEYDFLNEIEENIEEKFTGLKSKIKELGKEFQSDSYTKVIREIDETMKEVKTISKNFPKVKGSNFKADLNKIIKKKSNANNINVNIYPEIGFYKVKKEVLTTVLNFTDKCLDIIYKQAVDKPIENQIILHQDEYINILIEVDNIIINDDKIINNRELSLLLKESNAKIEIDQYSNTGTIISASFPLANKESLGKEQKKVIKVIIAEDHDVSLFGLVSLFKTKDDIELVGTAKNGMEVLKMLESKKTDIVITDISMPGMDGIELSEQLKNNYPDIKVIVFTMYLENWFVEQLVNNGAKGFVSKNSKIVELISAVRSVYEGNNYYCPQFKSKFGFKGNNNGIKQNLDSLSRNELQIIKYYADNCTKDQIAVHMKMNNKTIDNFVANILLKLNAGDEAEIIRIAKKQKFISE